MEETPMSCGSPKIGIYSAVITYEAIGHIDVGVDLCLQPPKAVYPSEVT